MADWLLYRARALRETWNLPNDRMQLKHQKRTKAAGAFTLIEVIVCMAVIGVVFVALYGGMAWGYTTIKMARENLRATQILVEKMEEMRVYTWDQITAGNFIPKTFTASYYPSGSTTNAQGIVYSGTVDVNTRLNLHNNYDDQMALITVTLNWTTGKLNRTRSVSTIASRYGLQNYLY